jgi:uncharacterized protein YdaU (DUF1376 family)
MRNPPAFQCYASDILASEEFRVTSLEERGLAWTMLMQCWVGGSVPRNPPDLARVLGLDLRDVERALTLRVLGFFEEQDNRLIRRELVEQKTEMIARRTEQSLGGRRGATRRWDKERQRITTSMGKASPDPIGSPEMKSAEQQGTELKRAGRRSMIRESEENEIEEYEVAFGEKQS